MSSNKSKGGRVDKDFIKEMKELALIRVNNRLSKFTQRDTSLAEMTRLLRRTDGWKQSKEELKTKPKKENLR